MLFYSVNYNGLSYIFNVHNISMVSAVELLVHRSYIPKLLQSL